MHRLEGKVGIVTGAGGGIGRAVAELFVAEGAAVVVADIDGPRAEETTNLITKEGGSAVPVEMDISREEDNIRMISTAVKEFGKLDILHANAFGVDTGGRDMERNDHFVTDVSQEIWDGTFAVTMRGTWLGCKHSILQMLEQGHGGSIVCTSSQAGTQAFLSVTAYGCAKAGVNALVKYIATQYGTRKIRANAVAPGWTMHWRNTGIQSPEWQKAYAESSLLGRVGAAEDIANAVLYLASDDAAFVTGQVLSVDGGAQVHQPEYADFRRLGVWGLHPIHME